MKKLKYILTSLLFVACVAVAQTYTGLSRLAWDYAVEDEVLIDGYKLYCNGAEVATIAPEQRSIEIGSANLTPGLNTCELTAYNAVDESAPSNTVSFNYVTTAPNAPTNFIFVIEVQ